MKRFKMKLNNKKEDFLSRYSVHWVQFYKEILQQVAKAKTKGRGINGTGEGIARVGHENKIDFNAVSSFNQFSNTEVLSE